jgi:hypothetical protein
MHSCEVLGHGLQFWDEYRPPLVLFVRNAVVWLAFWDLLVGPRGPGFIVWHWVLYPPLLWGCLVCFFDLPMCCAVSHPCRDVCKLCTVLNLQLCHQQRLGQRVWLVWCTHVLCVVFGAVWCVVCWLGCGVCVSMGRGSVAKVPVHPISPPARYVD